MVEFSVNVPDMLRIVSVLAKRYALTQCCKTSEVTNF